MIKFRKGLVPENTTAAVTPPTPAVSQTTPTTGPAAARVLEWWEIPSKYRRMPIDELECD